MKKIILIAACAVSTAAYALPTYEPFTEYSSLVAASSSNVIDLCTNGLVAPSGEIWSSLNFSGLAGNATGTHGLDVVVTNYATSVFTATALGSILPSTFPGMPATGQAIDIVAFNPAQPAGNSNTVGNSAVLQFAQDFVRPASGTKTLYISYLFSVVGKGQTGTGNPGRYLGFLEATNLVEPSSAYQFWLKLFNTFGTTRYFGHGVYNGAPEYIGPTDSSAAAAPPTNDWVASGGAPIDPFTTAYNTPNFVVGEYIMVSTSASSAGTKDTNIVWVNPSLGGFGGSTPPTSPIFTWPMGTAMTDVGGMVLIDRVGSGSSGGVSNTYVANLMLGNTWSYVTGGPEFTNQPASANGSGASVSLSAAATAAGQTISYQWQHFTATTTNDLINGAADPGGAAMVTIVTNANVTTLTLTDMSAADAGSYQVVATASSTGYTLTSATAVVTNDPLITVEPSSTSAPPGGSANFSISAITGNSPLSFQWKLNGANISTGTLGDGSTVTVVTSGNSSMLTIGNYQNDENPATITCGVTNSLGVGELSVPATLTKADPAIAVEPQPQTANFGTTATFTATVTTANPSVKYAWYDGSTMLVSGVQADGTTVTGAQGTNSSTTFTTTLTLSGVSYQDIGNYSLMATNSTAATVTSAAAALTVHDPFITAEPPASLEIGATSNVTISVGASGSGVTYSWQWTNGLGAGGITGDLAGATSSAIQISGSQTNDSGTYSVVISGASGQIITSSTTVLSIETPITAVTVGPSVLTQATNTHLAFLASISGGASLVHLQWQHNGVSLASGPQADGSWISGASTTISGSGTEALVLTNAQVADSGTYSVIASNVNGVVTNFGVLTIEASALLLSSDNLVVARVGEGSEALSGFTGNTLYLDQYTTSGAYVSTVMVPDTGSSTLIVPGAGNDYYNESCLTLSANGAYINFAGYFENYPFTGGDVTIGNITIGTLPAFVRSIGAVNALGYYTLAYTNEGLFSGGAHYIRSAYSTDGLTNFWCTGAAGGSAIKYVQAGPGGSSYATGNGVPGLSTAVNGPRCIGLVGTNLIYSDSGDASLLGLNAFNGTPEANGSASALIIPMGSLGASPNDFAVSPDGNTIYVADDMPFSSSSSPGGIDRFDTNAAAGQPNQWSFSYSLSPTAAGTNGSRSMTVNFPSSITSWGPGVTGAIIYATTVDSSTNNLVQLVDNGNPSTTPPTLTVLATAGVNELFRGVRFGPVQVPVSIVTGPLGDNTYVGQSDTLTVTATGDAPFTYQWQLNGMNLMGQTGTSLVLNNLQANQSGTYTVIVSDAVSTASNSAVVTVGSGPPVVLFPPQSLVESAGDHTAFSVGLTGTLPIFYQWATNGVNVPGATGSSLVLTNIASSNNGVYTVTYSNMFGTNHLNATLQVTAGLQALSPGNLVVARIGDGAQALSSSMGNTLYLDQIAPTASYVNTIMIPDNSAVANLIVRGGPVEGPYEGVLTESANTTFLNFVGFDTNYPCTSVPPFVDATPPASGDVVRSIGSVNAFGYFSMAQIVQTLYTAASSQIESAASSDGYAEFWTTGQAGSGAGLKYVTAAVDGPGGGIPSIGGSAAGDRVANLFNGSLYISDVSSSPIGIYGFGGAPTTATTPAVVASESSGSPNDFAISPDQQTMYVGDDRSIAGGGGIQRWDMSGGTYSLSYTLTTGNLSVGASGLTVDFSASGSWGVGSTGAIIYATTAGSLSNRLIKIVDDGASSGTGAVTLEQANASEILRGVRFAPVAAPPIMVTNPQPTTVFAGGTAVFTSFAVNGPITSYQWQLNGANLQDGVFPIGTVGGSQTPVLTIANVPASDDQGNYSVVISNPDGPTTASAVLTVGADITSFPPILEYVTNGGTAVFPVGATGGPPLTYEWIGPCGSMSDGPAPACNGSGATIAGSSTSSMTLADVTPADDGSYYVVVNTPTTSTNTAAAPTVLVVVNSPIFGQPPLSGLGSAPVLNISGTANSTYHIWGSTNLALHPFSKAWTLLGTGTFSGGADTFPISPTTPYEFYFITQP